jgi:ABC-type cobalamin/Fe3+-siderophores transport system ATPase subunit
VVEVLLEARDLTFAYPGGESVLFGADLRVEAGELVCLLGPNGAGKSTLLKLLAGLLRPDFGEVRLEHEALASLGPRARARRIAVVPQALSGLPDLTVHDFVAYGRYAYQGPFGRASAKDRDAVQRALVEADLEALAARPLAELSGGQRQRAMVARALAQEAEVLLVDEPTTALDPGHQIAVMELLASLGRRGRGLVVVTHDLNLASQFATRVVLLEQGRVVADGAVAQVLTRTVLEPVYGPALVYENWPVPGGTRPVVLPWRRDVDA